MHNLLDMKITSEVPNHNNVHNNLTLKNQLLTWQQYVLKKPKNQPFSRLSHHQNKKKKPNKQTKAFRTKTFKTKTKQNL